MKLKCQIYYLSEDLTWYVLIKIRTVITFTYVHSVHTHTLVISEHFTDRGGEAGGSCVTADGEAGGSCVMAYGEAEAGGSCVMADGEAGGSCVTAGGEAGGSCVMADGEAGWSCMMADGQAGRTADEEEGGCCVMADLSFSAITVKWKKVFPNTIKIVIFPHHLIMYAVDSFVL